MELVAPLINFNWTLLMQMVTVLILFLVLKKFFFEKVYNFVKAREAVIQDAFDSADATNNLANSKLDEYERQLAQADREGKDIIQKAKTNADIRAQKIIDEAEEKANQILTQAEQEIKRQQRKAIEEMRGEIADLAILAAERIIEKDLEKTEEQQKIIDKVISEVGNSEWQN